MTTLVTGASGFLGSHVARQLVARGEKVRVLLRASSNNRAIADLPLEYVTGDLRDSASLARALAGVTRVFHVAADYRLWAKHKQDIYDSNVGGTKNVLDAAKQGFAAIIAMPTTPVGPWDWKPTPTGKIILDFLNGKMPGYVETG